MAAAPQPSFDDWGVSPLPTAWPPAAQPQLQQQQPPPPRTEPPRPPVPPPMPPPTAPTMAPPPSSAQSQQLAAQAVPAAPAALARPPDDQRPPAQSLPPPAAAPAWQPVGQQPISQQPTAVAQQFTQPPPPHPTQLPIVLPPTAQPPPLTLASAAASAGCAPGLEYLASTAFVVVKQRIEPFEMLINFETANKYDVLDPYGRWIYFAAEESSLCCRCCCSDSRSFVMHVYDRDHREVFRIERPCRLSNPCCCCCQQELRVYAPPGNYIGLVEQTCSATCRPRYRIRNADNAAILKVHGPLCTCNVCCGDVVFQVKTVSGVEIGSISKKHGGMLKEMLTDADTFGVSYPADLDVAAKALLLATTFLIDFMFYEDNGQTQA